MKRHKFDSLDNLASFPTLASGVYTLYNFKSTGRFVSSILDMVLVVYVKLAVVLKVTCLHSVSHAAGMFY